MDEELLGSTIVLDRVLIELRTSAEGSEERLREMLAKIDEREVYQWFARRFERYLESIKIGGVMVHVRP